MHISALTVKQTNKQKTSPHSKKKPTTKHLRTKPQFHICVVAFKFALCNIIA